LSQQQQQQQQQTQNISHCFVMAYSLTDTTYSTKYETLMSWTLNNLSSITLKDRRSLKVIFIKGKWQEENQS
jgi:hypothetical protein